MAVASHSTAVNGSSFVLEPLMVKSVRQKQENNEEMRLALASGVGEC